MKRVIKACINWVFLAAALPAAALSGCGRVKPLYTIFAHLCALLPGRPGDYFRACYYHWTLREFSLTSRVSFGTFFAHTEARVGSRVYIGSNCIIGKAEIGDGTQIASAVQILSGQHQHSRDSEGAIFRPGQFVVVTIGNDCWIGAAAIVMADVGSKTTIGAGSVVTRSIPPNSVAVGSPARVIRSGEKLVVESNPIH